MNIMIDYSVFIDVSDIQEYDIESDDSPLAILFYICEYLDEVEGCSFVIEGFGQDIWPTTIDDLPILMSYLPNALRSLSRNEPFEIDFYEQGLERVLKFYPKDKTYVITCKSRTDWVPEPDLITSDSIALKKLFDDLLDTFLFRSKGVRKNKNWSKLLNAWISVTWKP